ncbi:MAG: DUF5107 domain-containing protein [Anaerolineae bacterium]
MDLVRRAMLLAVLVALAGCKGGSAVQPEPPPTSPRTATAAAVRPTATPVPPTATSTPPRPTPTPPPSATPSPSPTASSTVVPSATPTSPPSPTPTIPALSLREEMWEVAAYPFALHTQRVPSDEAPGFSFLRLDWEAYGAAGPHPLPTAFPSLVLENQWLRVVVVPVLGGRVAELTYTPTGHNELYRNPVLKPTHWGPPEQGWWLAAGGLEWCFPVPEHGYLWAEAWAAQARVGGNAASVVLRSPEGPPLTVEVTVRLPEQEAALHLAFRIHNRADHALAFAYWTNAMLAPGPENHPSGDLHFLIPAHEVQVHSTGDPRLPGAGQVITWPLWNGLSLDRLGGWEGWLGFFAHPRAQEGFAAVYDPAADEGVVRVFPEEAVPGLKGFAFGYGPGSPGPEAWTDDGSAYVELHGGLAPTFDDRVLLGGGQEVTWEEVWYPVAGLGDLIHADRHAALGLVQGEAGPALMLQATRPGRGTLLLLGPGGGVVLRQDVAFSPGTPLRLPLEGALGPGEVRLLDENGKTLYTYAWQRLEQEGKGIP